MNRKQLLETAIKAAVTAGQEVLKIYNDPNENFTIEIKADNSPLTKADKKSHNVILECLQKSGLPILSEEGKDITYEARKNWETFWMVDPLDGTKEFIKRNDEFTINIALINKTKPVIGVIYVPTTKTIYIGSAKTGAFKMKNINIKSTYDDIINQGVKLPKTKGSNNYVVIGSRSHMNQETKVYISKLQQQHSSLDFKSIGSSLKICMVAEGIADEYPRFAPTMEWDTAAGHAILNSIGKKLWLTNFSSQLIYNKEELINPYFIAK